MPPELRGFADCAALAALALVVVVARVDRCPECSDPPGDWLAFGRTPDNSRLSPLTEITPANVAQLQRAYILDFQRIDPDVRRGQQSYPLALDGKLYVTTNDDNVFALDGATGKVLWQYKPSNSGFFKNFGIAANRGLAYCDGRLFISQLDMKLVALQSERREGARESRAIAPGRAERVDRTTGTPRPARRSARTTAS